VKGILSVWFFALGVAFAAHPTPVTAQSGRLSDTELSQEVSPKTTEPSVVARMVVLSGRTKIMAISDKEHEELADSLLYVIQSTHNSFRTVFGPIEDSSTVLNLMDSEEFYRTTKAPRWTNALYYKGQIIIPIVRDTKPDMDNLIRSVKHEYTHAVVHALSAGKCPGWLDEGLAQAAEGVENPALAPAMVRWLDRNRPVPLVLLKGGFTKLETKMVPAAYAQSLLAAKQIVNRSGYKAVRNYFDRLSSGEAKPIAFKKAFNLSEGDYEKELGNWLLDWHSDHLH